MLIESTVNLPVSLAMFQDVFHPPNSVEILRTALRVLHLVAGITWIGLLFLQSRKRSISKRARCGD